MLLIPTVIDSEEIRVEPAAKRTCISRTTKDRVIVPTATPKKDMEIDLHSLADEDLKSLQKNDPFLYYSIPGVREAELSIQEVDHSKIPRPTTKVTRKTRFSMEKHVSLVIEELFEDELCGLDDSDCESDDSDYLDVMDALLAKLLLKKE